MAKSNKDARPEARLPKGLRDIEAAELRAQWDMIAKVRAVYERYGFEPLETPAFEYTDALGKFLPDQERPNAGVFSFNDEDENWNSLRYDLTAPLARYVAQNFDRLPKPFRRYAVGPVWRNEKPGPGRFRQFIQFDADTVGAEGVAADAEMCMLAADTLEALGVPRGDYVIKVNSRKVLDGLMASVGLCAGRDDDKRLITLRAIDKADRLGLAGVRALLGAGRQDESGDFTRGADLYPSSIDRIVNFTGWGEPNTSSQSSIPANVITLSNFEAAVGNTQSGAEGIRDLRAISEICESAGYFEDRIVIDPSCVRGLEYYTGPVFEAELTFQIPGDDGQPMRFGSVGGGGRYDDLVARFTGQRVPATGFSIGVSRLQAALAALNKAKANAASGPVVVLVMDKDRIAETQMLVQKLRSADIPSELYLGSSGMKAQMKYADKRGSPCVVIQGSDERERGEVQIKDLVEGAKAAAAIKDNAEWKAQRPAQVSVKVDEMVATVRDIVARYRP